MKVNKDLSELKWCSNCLTMSTRPRITFDSRGWPQGGKGFTN